VILTQYKLSKAKTSDKALLTGENFLQVKCKYSVHFFNTLVCSDPKKLFHNNSITKTKNVYYHVNLDI